MGETAREYRYGAAVEIRQFTPEDAESAARLYIQSAEHHVRLDPDFYRVPPLEAVVAHYEDVTERIQTEPFNCFVAESDATVVGNGWARTRLPSWCHRPGIRTCCCVSE